MIDQDNSGWDVGVLKVLRRRLQWGLLALLLGGVPGVARSADPPVWLDQAHFDRLLEEVPLSPEEVAEGPLELSDSGLPLGDSPVLGPESVSDPREERVGVFERGPHHQKVRQKVDHKRQEKGRKDRLKALEKEIKDFEKKHREVVKSMDAPTMPDPLSTEQRAWMALITEEEDLKAEIKALKGKGKGEEELEEYTELASGLHYWSPSKKKWRRSKAKIELVDGIGVARQGQQRVLFAPDLSAEGSIDISTSDGKRLKATVLGLAYVDVTTGEDAIIATVQSTVGEIVGENQIVYVDAFQGIEADVVYTYEEVGLEQDVILKSQILGPEAFGMDPEKVRLEVLTEFYDAPLVEKRTQVLRDASEDATGAELEPALVDEGLSFGSVEIAMGSAFWREAKPEKGPSKKKGKKDEPEDRPVGANGLPAGLEHEFPRLKYPVAKHWLEQDGRTILCEGVRFAAVSEMLADLPQPKKERAALPARFPAQGRIVVSARSGARQIPQLHRASNLDEQIAKIQYAQPETLLAMAAPGFVMDYQTLNTAPAYTFEAGRTYLIQSDMVIRGTTLIEGGTVIKFNRSTSTRKVQLRCLGSVVCDTEPYRPAIFTARDDHQYGVNYWSSTPLSGYYAANALWIEPSGEPVTIQHIRVKHAMNGVFFENSRGAKLRHSQIIGCRHPVATRHQDLEVENVLIDDFGKYAFWAMHSWPPEQILPGQEVNIHASHVTVSNGPWLAWNSHWNGSMGTTEFKNSLLVNVNGGYAGGSFYPGDIGDIFIHSPFLPNVPHASVFATQNLGHFYLPTGSPHRDAGHAPVDPLLALDLRQRTTSAPNLVQGYVGGSMGPFVALDDDGSLDLGYHYARIDHAIHYAIANSNVTVGPGTVVSCSGSLGMQVGASHWYSWWSPRKRITLQGEPGNHVLCVDDDTVQEQSPLPNVYRSTMMRFNERYTTNELRASFTDVYGIGRHAPIEVPYGIERFADVEFRDSTFQGVHLNIRLYTSSDRFRAVNVLFKECFGVGFDGDAGIVRLANCLFYRSPLYLYGNNASLYHWSIENSVFDQSRLYGNGLWNMGASQFQKNAFVGYLSWGDWPYWQMRPTLTLATPYPWQSGPLGEFYQPSSDNPLLNAGSRNANLGWGEFRLAHHTVRDDLQPEGNTRIDLGYHYIATDANGNALDDNLDGIPNYQQDTNGNGVVDPGEVAWTSSPLDPDGDEDGDGLTNYEETQLFAQYNLDPHNPDSDGDGISDAQEDFDGDGLSNGYELRRYQSSPTNARSLDPAGVALDSQIIFSRSSAPLDPSSAAALASVLATNAPPSQAPPQQSPVAGSSDDRPISFAQSSSSVPGAREIYTKFEGIEIEEETNAKFIQFSIQGDFVDGTFDLYSRADLGPSGFWKIRRTGIHPGEIVRIYIDDVFNVTASEFFVGYLSEDTDQDGLPDGFELLTSGCILGSDQGEGGRDLDGDGLSNLYEWHIDSNLRAADTDFDGDSDREEVYGGGHPFDPNKRAIDLGSGRYVEIPKGQMQVSASSSAAGFPPTFAIDGQLEIPGQHWESLPERGHWLRIDLGDRYPMKRLNYHAGIQPGKWRFPGTPDDISALRMFVTDSDSLDPKEWGTQLNVHRFNVFHDWVGNIELDAHADVRFGRYVILYNAKPAQVHYDLTSSLAEVSLFASGLPVISPIPDLRTEMNRSTVPVEFEIGHLHHGVSSMLLSAHSSHVGLIDPSGIQISGNGARRTLELHPQPNQTGSAQIRLILQSGGHVTERTVNVSVESILDADGDGLTRHEELDLLGRRDNDGDSDEDGIGDGSDPDGRWFPVLVQVDRGFKPIDVALNGQRLYLRSEPSNPSLYSGNVFINPSQLVTFTLSGNGPLASGDQQFVRFLNVDRTGAQLPWLPGPVDLINGDIQLSFTPFRVRIDVASEAAAVEGRDALLLPANGQPATFTFNASVVLAGANGLSIRRPLEMDSRVHWQIFRAPGIGFPAMADGWLDLINGSAELSYTFQRIPGARYVVQATMDRITFIRPDTGAIFDSHPGTLAFSGRTEPIETTTLEQRFAVDNNGDQVVSFGVEDQTSRERPYRFWINNDSDQDSKSKNDHPWTSIPDFKAPLILGRRDLEDFSRLQLNATGFVDELLSGQVQAIIRFKRETAVMQPKINLWLHLDADGGTGYLDSLESANEHSWLTYPAPIGVDDEYVVDRRLWTGSSGTVEPISEANPIRYLLFEGAGEGTGELVVEFRRQGQLAAESAGCWLQLMDVRRMYERVRVAPLADPSDPYTFVSDSPPDIATRVEGDQGVFPFLPSEEGPANGQDYIVFVHGWRMPYLSSQSFGITMFKRLWWSGYRGRFATFRWPTYSFESGLDFSLAENVEAYLSKYNESEYRAWKSGAALKEYLESLPAEYSVNVAAHSMGNIVVGSALEQGLTRVRNYAMLQAAIPAECYDPRQELRQAARDQIFDAPGLPPFPYRAWDFESISDDSHGPTAALGYRGRLTNVSGRVVNFGLPQDFATRDSWEFNNSFGKPLTAQSVFDWKYVYEPNAVVGQRIRFESELDDPDPSPGVPQIKYVRAITHAHEAMTMVAQSQTRSVGAELRTRGGVGASVDLGEETTYNFRNEHSAEFDREIQRVRLFYSSLQELLLRP